MKEHKIFAFPFETERLAEYYIALRNQSDRVSLYARHLDDGWYVCSTIPRSEYMSAFTSWKIK